MEWVQYGYWIRTSVTFSVTDTERNTIELELAPTDAIIIGDHIAPPPTNPPKGLGLLRQVTVEEECLTACQHRGYTYVGLFNGRIDRIDFDGNVEPNFMKFEDEVISVRVHNNRIFTLVVGQSHKMFVHELSGQPVISWVHADTQKSFAMGSKLCILGDQLAELIKESLSTHWMVMLSRTFLVHSSV